MYDDAPGDPPYRNCAFGEHVFTDWTCDQPGTYLPVRRCLICTYREIGGPRRCIGIKHMLDDEGHFQ